jgi:macrolide transport system ATP-binding/permease protein
MKTLRACFARLGGLFNRDSHDRDLSEELASHVALHMDDNLRSGMTPEEARRAACIRLGGTESVKETVREQRGFPVIDSFLCDISAERPAGLYPGALSIGDGQHHIP